MNALTDDQLATLNTLLDEREAQLQAEVRGSKQNAEEEREVQAGVPPDMVDVAQARRIGDMRYAETERDMVELIDIAEARERMATGDYGVCEDCEQEIGFARLQVEPSARRCIECQESYERTHRSVPLVPTGLDQP